MLFRRALKLINGGLAGGVNNLPATGFTVVAENPVYIQGNYNADRGERRSPNRIAPAAVIADSITLLSNAFNDAMTFRFPNDQNNRNAIRHRLPLRDGDRQGDAVPEARRMGRGGTGLGRRRAQLHENARGLGWPRTCATAARW